MILLQKYDHRVKKAEINSMMKNLGLKAAYFIMQGLFGNHNVW